MSKGQPNLIEDHPMSMEAAEVEAHVFSRGLMHGNEDVVQTPGVGGEVTARGEVIAVEE